MKLTRSRADQVARFRPREPSAVNPPSCPCSLLGYTLSYSPLEQILRADAALAEQSRCLTRCKSEPCLRTGVDQRSDLYSLGATLYHLLTAQIPMQAPTRPFSLVRAPRSVASRSQINQESPVIGVLLAGEGHDSRDRRPPGQHRGDAKLPAQYDSPPGEGEFYPPCRRLKPTSAQSAAGSAARGDMTLASSNLPRRLVRPDPRHPSPDRSPISPTGESDRYDSVAQARSRHRPLLYLSLVILALLSISALAIGINYFLIGSGSYTYLE